MESDSTTKSFNYKLIKGQYLFEQKLFQNSLSFLYFGLAKQFISFFYILQSFSFNKPSMKLHYCTDIPIQYRYRKIKSVITALGADVADFPRETFADLRQLSPIPTLPLLQTQQGNFTSSNTIIRYLAAKAEYKLYGKQNLHDRALIDQWLDITQCDFDTCAIALNVYLDGKQVDIEAVTADAEKFLTHLNKHLKNRNFLVGDSLSIADLAVAATIAPVLANMYGQQERRKYSLISSWYHKIAEQNKQIQPKELPKKIHKKFEKKKDKNDKQQQKPKEGKGKQKQKQKGKAKQQTKQKDGATKQKKQKKDKKPKDGQEPKKEQAVAKQVKKAEKKEDDDDLFGDSAEQTEAPKVAAKKPQVKKEGKKKAAAKSIVVFHVKVYEQEQDLNALADKIRNEVKQDGLVWNPNHELKPVAYGMNMLEIGCVIEDDKVSVEEDIYNKILEWEKQVQSVDTANFQKL